MKRLLLGVGLCVTMAASAAGQMPKYGVTVNAEKNVDFAKFKTYTWTKGQPSSDKQIDAQIMAAVDKELGGLGMTKASSGTGDVMVAYYSLSRTDVNLKAKPDEKGLRPQYTVGSLMVALLDSGTRKRLLRLRIDKPLEGERSNLEPEINSAVAQLFEKYPTRSAK